MKKFNKNKRLSGVCWLRAFIEHVPLCVVFVVAFLLQTSTGCLAGEGSIFSYDKNKNTISVSLNNTSIHDFVRKFSTETGISIALDREIDRKLTAKFDNMPLELGVKRILGTISSSFIFVEEKDNGKINYRLSSIKIFKRGNFASGDFSNITPGNSSSQNIHSGSINIERKLRESELPTESSSSPGAIRFAILTGQKNLSIIRRKNMAEVRHYESSIADLEFELSQGLSPLEMRALTEKLIKARNELNRVKSINRQIILEEEKNLRMLAEQALEKGSK